MVEARSLRMALNAYFPRSARAARVRSRHCRRWSGATDGATVRIAGNGSTRNGLHCRLVVAAEGRQSPLREAAGIPVTRLPYGQTGIVCAISHERPHDNLALEHFLPSGPFAALPMGPSADAELGGAPNISAIVWTERTPIAEQVLRHDNARFGQEIARRLGGHLGGHLGVIRIVGRRWSYPLSAMLVHRYVDTRLALAGDAAHGIHPIAGQGLNLGFRDAIALAELVIEAAGRGEDPGGPALLARYQRHAAAGQHADAGDDRRAGAAVQQRQSAAAAGTRHRHRRSGPHPAVEATVHAPRDGACGVNRPVALRHDGLGDDLYKTVTCLPERPMSPC